MANCKNCAAPLAANTNICEYCRVRNDVDLQNTQFYNVTQDSGNPCPCCYIPLQTVCVAIGRQFYIDRCPDCLGLFFKPDINPHNLHTNWKVLGFILQSNVRGHS